MIPRRPQLTSVTIGVALVFVGFCHAAEGPGPSLRPRADVQWRAVPKQVLAFYYDWYGNPSLTGHWEHWEKVDEMAKRIGSSTHYPTLGPDDSHDHLA